MYIHNRLGLLESTETMLAQQNRLTKLSNNLANADTVGFKKEDLTFWEMLHKTSEERLRVGKAIHEVTNHQAGPMQETGNPFDLAIQGDGFFRIQTAEGVRYTRAGDFTINGQGQLATANGDLVLSDAGPLLVDGQNVSVAPDGAVWVDGQLAGNLGLATFAEPEKLLKAGQNLFSAGPDVLEEVAEGFTMLQGYLEKSNVNVINEMTALIDLNRAHATQQRVIHTFDNMDDKAISRVGKLNS